MLETSKPVQACAEIALPFTLPGTINKSSSLPNILVYKILDNL